MSKHVPRTLPHSLEAEQGVLGSMLISPREIIAECVEKINAEYFYVPAHQTIYTILVELWNAGQGIDLITFTQVLRDRNVLDAIGGAAFITSLFTFVPTAANVGYYLEIVRDKSSLRDIIRKSNEAIQLAYEEQDDVQGLMAHIHSSFISLRGETTSNDGISLQVDRALEELEEDVAHKGKKDRIPTGLIDLDRILNIMPEDLVVIAGESSSGKTSLAMNIVEHASINLGIGSLIFSIETPSKQLIFRMMASQAKVNVLETAQLGDKESVRRLMDASARIKKAPITIEDDPDVTALQLRARARKLCSEKDIRLILIDYLQILTNGGKKESTEAQELSDRTMSFKRMARELGVPVLLLSQIEETSGKTFGSRAVRHHADTLLKINQGDPGTIFLDKQRNGPRNRFVKVNFFPQWTRFENYIEEQK